MVENTTGTSQLLANYSYKNKSVTTLEYQQSKQNTGIGQGTIISDTVNLSHNKETVVTYNQSMSLEGVLEAGYEKLREMVLNVFREQGIDTKVAIGNEEVELADISQEEAQELIAEDGYFGVEKTSERIFQLAVGITGNDPSRLDAVREGVKQGFEAARDAFGGWLPDISYDTYDAVMNKLDDWAESKEQGQ